MHKYGRDFAANVMDNKDNCVSDRVSGFRSRRGSADATDHDQVTKKLAYMTPPDELVDNYMFEIAKGYGVPYAVPSHDNSDPNVGDGGAKVRLCSISDALSPHSHNDLIALVNLACGCAYARDAKTRCMVASAPQETADLPLENPITIADKIAADEKQTSLPSVPSSGENKAGGASTKGETKKDPDEFDEFQLLAKRFEALKKR